MCSRKLLAVLALSCLCSVLVSAQDTSRIISNQELIISICQRLTASLATKEAILQRESESLTADRQALTQEKADFESYKQSTQASETELRTLKDSLKIQSEQLAVCKVAVPAMIAVIALETIVLIIRK